MKAKPRSVVCDVCGKTGAGVPRVARSYGKGATLLVIENIPVVTCPHCNASYLTAEVMHELEQIKRNRNGSAAKRSVAVAEYA